MFIKTQGLDKVDPIEGKKQYWNHNKMIKHFYKIMWVKQFTDLQWRLTIIPLVWILVYLERLQYTKGKKGWGTHELKAPMAGAYPGFHSMKPAQE